MVLIQFILANGLFKSSCSTWKEVFFATRAVYKTLACHHPKLIRANKIHKVFSYFSFGQRVIQMLAYFCFPAFISLEPRDEKEMMYVYWCMCVFVARTRNATTFRSLFIQSYPQLKCQSITKEKWHHLKRNIE